MSHCAHEHHDHGAQDGDEELGMQYSLYLKINIDQVECLNEEEYGSGKNVFKAWETRLDHLKWVSSDVDEELVLSIPFTGLVKLKALVVIGGEHGSHPKTMRLFKNNPGMSFEDVHASEPTQIFNLSRDDEGRLEYPTKVVKFASIHHLTVHFADNFGAESTKIYYLGLRGDFQETHREKAIIATYEARALPQDHKGSLHENVHHQIK